ncbi:MAG: hypothetical protein K2K68_08480 [Duncaniella sp.]|nr:hypothetical protein [Duncaniella sp.]
MTDFLYVGTQLPKEYRENCKFFLDTSDNWNDYGYKTLCVLYKILDSGNLHKIGYFKCFNGNGEKKSRFYLSSTNSRAFIMDYKTVFRMLFYMSIEERKKLIDLLHLCILFKNEENNQIFKDSILRNWSDFETFKHFNDYAKNLILTEFEVSTLFLEESKELYRYLK